MLSVPHYLSALLLVCFVVVPAWAETQQAHGGGMLQAVTLDNMNRWIREAMKKRITVRHESPVLHGGVRTSLVNQVARSNGAKSAQAAQHQASDINDANLVQHDGRYLYALSREGVGQARQGVRILDTQYQGGKLRQLSYVGFGDDTNLQSMYFLPKQQLLVLLGSAYTRQGNATHLIYIDVKNKRKPKVLQHIKLDGQQRASQRIGKTLYLTLSHWLQLPQTYQRVKRQKALSDQERVVYSQQLEVGINRWSIASKLPMYTAVGNKKPLPLIQSGKFYMNQRTSDQIYNMTVLLAIDLGTPDTFRFNSQAYFGHVGYVQSTKSALYLAAHYYDDLRKKKSALPIVAIHKFAYQGVATDYRGSAVVPGYFSHAASKTLQFYENTAGHLQVFSHNKTARRQAQSGDPVQGSPMIITALTEHPLRKALITLSQLPNQDSPEPLGSAKMKGYHAKVLGGYAYLVAPDTQASAHIVDMRNSWQMKPVSKASVAGFTGELYPITETLLLGVASKAQAVQANGLQISLFDISNPRQPVLAAVHRLGSAGSYSSVSQDPSALSIWPISDTLVRVALPVSLVSKAKAEPQVGLYPFDIILPQKHISAIAPLTPTEHGWAGEWHDRSILLDQTLYYYHNNQFWKRGWRQERESLVGR